MQVTTMKDRFGARVRALLAFALAPALVLVAPLGARARAAQASAAQASTAQTSAAPSNNTTASAVAPERQILWQRSLDDALSLSAAEKRPILIAVNMDGESASERIVRERYRDPAFVASTRSFVCVVASVFRHTPRDYDENGRRIPCPRLGEITCGEHIALEPILYDKYLQGDRIAPRHALILLDGTKNFDLTLLFDLHDLDKKLAASVPLAPPPLARAPLTIDAAQIRAELDSAGRIQLWAELARARDQRGRAAFEDVLGAFDDEANLGDALSALESAGDAGSIGALRIVLPRATHLSDTFVDRTALVAKKLRTPKELAAAARERISGLGPTPGLADIESDAKLLPLIGRLDGTSPGVRSVLIAYALIGSHADEARRALSYVLAPDEMKALDACARRVDAPLDLAQLIRFSQVVSARAPQIAKPSEEPPPADELEKKLAALDHELSAKPRDKDLAAQYGIACLNLARRRIESKGPGAQLLLEDAMRWLDYASELGRNDAAFEIERARTAYFQAKYADEVRFGEAALGAYGFRPIASARAKSILDECAASDPSWRTAKETEVASRALEDVHVVEAMRWIGDGHARLLAERSGGKVFDEAYGIHRGVTSLALVAVSSSSDETDWTSLGSFFGALGMNREELACLEQGALRLPESTVLRSSLNGALWSSGRIDLASAKAEWILSMRPDSAASMWFAGYAHILAAENFRRREEPERALESYHSAENRFTESAHAKPEYSDSVKHYLAIAALGRGFAHLIADRRDLAGDALAAAIAIEPAVSSARDGLDREAIDLCDGALEWRESGASPVDALKFLAELEKADPKNAAWARAVSDSELREALRAVGRNAPAEADRYLDVSIAAARRGVAIEDNEENRRPLAQSLTIAGEQRLERGDGAGARKLLFEAAPLVDVLTPSSESPAALKDLATALRKKLGAARPINRPGR